MPEHSVQCPHCSESLTDTAMGAHIGLCPQRPAMCMHCHMALTQSTLTAHEACCNMRPLLCPHCATTLTVARVRVDAHAAMCDTRMVSCKHCSLKLKASALPAHEASSCLLQPECVSIFDDFSTAPTVNAEGLAQLQAQPPEKGAGETCLQAHSDSAQVHCQHALRYWKKKKNSAQLMVPDTCAFQNPA